MSTFRNHLYGLIGRIKLLASGTKCRLGTAQAVRSRVSLSIKIRPVRPSKRLTMPQSLASIYLHAIFSTKNRQPIISIDWQEELFNVLSSISKKIDCPCNIVNGVSDHVHMLFQLNRTITVSAALNKIKSTSSAWVNDQIKPSSTFHWQAGYAVFSVSQSNVNAVARYIMNQAQHHQKVSFQDELIAFLKKYKLDYDERYLWE
ncbi:MAG: IS200/IS605 family transposase [Zavarzinella sp.]